MLSQSQIILPVEPGEIFYKIFYSLFWDYKIITLFLHSVSSLKTSHIVLLLLFEICSLLCTNCYIHICIYIRILKYKLLLVRIFFRAGHLILRKTISENLILTANVEFSEYFCTFVLVNAIVLLKHNLTKAGYMRNYLIAGLLKVSEYKFMITMASSMISHPEKPHLLINPKQSIKCGARIKIYGPEGTILI